MTWRTSSHSNSGACVEAGNRPGVVAVRDSALERARPGSSPVLKFSPGAWAAFTGRLKEPDEQPPGASLMRN